jgi:hypothetical protein
LFPEDESFGKIHRTSIIKQMKLASIIAIIFVLALNMVPCSDVVAMNAPFKTELRSADQHAEKSADACSPFCHCSCCSASSLIVFSTLKLVPFSDQGQAYRPQSTEKFIDVSLPVWQPPQLH